MEHFYSKEVLAVVSEPDGISPFIVPAPPGGEPSGFTPMPLYGTRLDEGSFPQRQDLVGWCAGDDRLTLTNDAIPSPASPDLTSQRWSCPTRRAFHRRM